MSNNLFSDLDFSSLDSPAVKEDSVREDLVMPLLKELGYSSQSENQIKIEVFNILKQQLGRK
jgi:hypothetical protein